MKFYYALAPVLATANQVVRFDDPKFLLANVLDSNDLDANTIFERFMAGRWCKTLDDFSYPIENDDWTYLQDKPVEKWCKMWRLCRIETKRNEISCNRVNYRKAPGLNNQKGFFAKTNMLSYTADTVDFSNPLHLQSKVLAGHVCETEVNETPCLKKTCNCDLQLADKVLDHVVEVLKSEGSFPIKSEEIAAPVVEEITQEEAIAVEQVAVEEGEKLENEIQNEIEEQVDLNVKVEEIVQDHATLVDEHTKLVEDIAAFKHKVQDVVEEHAKTTVEETEPVVVEEEPEVANEVIDDIASFNQDFTFAGAIKK